MKGSFQNDSRQNIGSRLRMAPAQFAGILIIYRIFKNNFDIVRLRCLEKRVKQAGDASVTITRDVRCVTSGKLHAVNRQLNEARKEKIPAG